MLQQTLARTDGLPEVGPPVVVCNEAHAVRVLSQLRDAQRTARAVILEPVGRNTAPAVALAALQVLADVPPDGLDPLLLVLPADHVVLDVPAFARAVERARPLAESGRLVTFGVVPDRPHTGYGYIRAGGPGRFTEVAQFVEKPDLETAKRLIAEGGGITWNSGMFLLGARAYLDELDRHAPQMRQACARALADGRHEGPVVKVDAEAFAACPADSIDYAVMEKTTRASVVPLRAGWSDVGSWAALHEVRPHDEAANATAGDVVAEDCDGCLIHSEHRLVAAVGLSDMIVVESDDAVLVAPRHRSEEVKRIVRRLDEQGRTEVERGSAREWSWGREQQLPAPWSVSTWATTVETGCRTPPRTADGDGCQVIVVRGAGTVQRGADEIVPLGPTDTVTVAAGQSFVLAAGDQASLELLVVGGVEPAPA